MIGCCVDPCDCELSLVLIDHKVSRGEERVPQYWQIACTAVEETTDQDFTLSACIDLCYGALIVVAIHRNHELMIGDSDVYFRRQGYRQIALISTCQLVNFLS